MSTLYVTQQDTVLRKTDERLKVTQKSTTLLDVPLIKVSEVVVFGRVTVTAATVQALLDHHIPVCYLSEHGRYVGRIEPSLSKNSLLRSAQYRAAFDPEVTLALARQIVCGKLTNMRVLLHSLPHSKAPAAWTPCVVWRARAPRSILVYSITC
jgi:CRISPR-associated protein Cas1